LLLLSFLAFLLFGPKKTPELARKVGSAIGQFNRATNDLQTKLVSEATSILPQRGASIDTTFAARTRSIVAAPPAVGPLETAKECGDSKASTADAAAVTVEPSKTPEPQ
jgi:TatA/E family protein of Tat protein translocase